MKKIYLKFSAKKTRKEIIEIIEKLKDDEDFGIRSDLKMDLCNSFPL